MSRKTQDAIADLQLDEYGKKERKFTKAAPATKRRTTKNKAASTSQQIAEREDSDDASDGDFTPGVVESSSSDDEEADMEPTNEEVNLCLMYLFVTASC